MARQNQGYIFTLDGWRALAIIAVLADHIVGYEFHGHRWLFALTRIGANGVSLFFAISGFLICSRLLEEQSAFGRISLKGFYIRRACRILPAALAYLMFITLLAFLGYIALDRREFWATLFFWRNYLPKGWIHRGWGGYTVHYWSLAVEEHFYLIWPILLVATGNERRVWWPWPLPSWWRCGAGGISIISGLRLYCPAYSSRDGQMSGWMVFC